MKKNQLKPKYNKKNLIVLAVVLSNMLGASYCSAADVSTLGELQTVTTDTSTKTRDATLTNDITVPNSSTIGAVGDAGVGTTLTVDGKSGTTNYSITGAGAGNESSGWVVNSANVTFNLKNAGLMTGTTVTKAIQNFVTTGNGAVLNISAGTANISDSVFYNNTAGTSSVGGGVIWNTGASTKVNITNSTFLNNTSQFRAGAIYNTNGATLNIGTSGGSDTTKFIGNRAISNTGGAIFNDAILNSYAGVTFAGNFAKNGGALRNTGATAISTIDGATFKWNGYSDYNHTNDTASTVTTDQGGAIMNETSARLTITNSTFINNASSYAATGGGAIINSSTVLNALNIGTSSTTDTTKFINNKSTIGKGGAIYNTGTLNSYTGVTFAGNHTGSTGKGGAIYNAEATAVVNIDGNTFKWNGYSNYNPTTDTATAVSTSVGGAIYNTSGAKLYITNSTFNNNAATGSGGAILNYAALNIGTSGSTDTTSFINNKGGGGGGAIFNRGTLNSYAGVAFAGNYSSNASNKGGAIFNGFAVAVVKIIGNDFKWNGYSDYSLANNTATTIATQNGGAIYSEASAKVSISNTSFTNNAATTNGGAIYNDATVTTYIQGDGAGKQTLFQGNKAAGVSNAIYLAGTDATTNSSNLYLNAGNSGKIVSYDGIAGSNKDYNFVYINDSDATASKSFIDGTTSLTNGQVDLYGDITGVTVNDYNGTINFGDSTAPKTACYNGTAFNLSGGTQKFYNASTGATFNTTGGTQNFNAAIATSTINSTGGTQGFNAISGSTLNLSSGTQNFNGAISSSTTINSTGGVQNLNSSLTGSTLSVNGGEFKVSSTGSIATSTLNLTSGTLNFANGITDTVALTDFNANAAGTLRFDANMNTLASDRITVSGVASGQLTGSVNITADAATNGTSLLTLITGGNIGGLELQNIGPTVTTYGKYTFTGSTNGTYSVSSEWANGLNSAVAMDTYATRTYSGTDNTTVSANLGTMGLAGSTLNIYGNGYGISGNGKSGVTVLSGQTLNIQNVGTAANSTSWNGFNAANGGAIYNSGLTTISSSIFENNTATTKGGAIWNSGTLNITNSTFKNNASLSGWGGAINIDTGTLNIGTSSTTDTTKFIKNQANRSGGAINNNWNLNSYSGVTFAGNYTPSSYNGGAINNTGTLTVAKIIGNTFKWNGYSDYDFTNDTANNVSTGKGGAIHNANGGVVRISNTSFTNNAVTTNGGAILNAATATTYIQGDGVGKQTLFQGNKANGVSNAIYLAGTNATTNASKLYLNAGNSGKIVSHDGISGSNILFNNIYINDSNATASTSFIDGSTVLTNGQVDLYGDITGATVYDYAGTTNFGLSGTPKAACYSGTAFNLSGGTQNFYNASTSATFNTSGGTQNFSGAISTSTINSTGGTQGFKAISGSTLALSSGTQNFNGAISSSTTINSTGGVQNLNSSLSGSTLSVDGGEFKVSSTGSIASTVLNLTSGTLNLVNGITDTVALTDFNANAAGTLKFDIDLETGINDKITVSGVASGELTSSINITNGSANPATPITLVTGDHISGLTLKDVIATYTTFNKYTFTGSTNGTYTVAMDWVGGLNAAVAVDSLDTRAFSATADTTVTADLGTMGKANSNLDIYGNGHSINGDSKAGIAVLSGQSLNISGVGSVANNKSYNGFVGTQGGAINNSGTTTIKNSIFSSNSAINGAVAYNNASGILNIGSSTTTDTSKFINNSSTTGNAGAIYNLGTLNSYNGVTFAGNSASNLNNGGAVYNTSSSAVANITGNTFKYNGYSDYIASSDSATTVSTANGGAIYNTNSAKLNVVNSTFSNNAATANGGAIYNDATSVFENSSFINNIAQSGNGGAIYNTGSGTLSIIADNANVTFSGNKASGASNAIYLDSTSKMNVNAGNLGSVTFNDKIVSANLNEININKPAVLKADGVSTAPTNGTVNINNNIVNSTINLYNGTLALGADNYLDNNNLNLSGGTLNMMNNATGIMNLNALQINSATNLKIDANLAAGTADYIKANSVSGAGKLNINQVNLLSDATVTTTIPVASTTVSNYVTLNATTAESALYKYNLSYSSSTGAMSFVNTKEFTPAIVTPQVSAMVGSYLNQTNTYHEALSNLDSLMLMPKLERLLYTSKNKTASTDGTFVFSPLMLHEDTKGLWCKQYSTFENVPLNNGPNVSNVGYGAIIGGDSELSYLGKGYTGYLTPYVGYNGSHQNYGNVGTYQNGGLVGLTGSVYKGDFFLAVTASMSANNGNASTPSGTDNFTTLVAGLAAKGGYNYEIMNGKFIVQPSLLMAYTFVKTFDYTTSSGAGITSDPLNAIQISPGLKVIANMRDGWQPYLGVNMVWNLMDTTKFYANDVQLPQMSVAPYVEYGIGLQRNWGGRFTGFGQAMLRGGGRNGVSLQFGFKYALGK